MMYLEHLNLVVKDLKKSLNFYQIAFPHWKIRAEGDSDWYGKARHWLHFGDDYHYLALSDHGEGLNRDLAGHSIGLAHFCYVTNNLEAVVNRLTAAGYEIASNGAENKFRKNVYFIDPDGFEIEFVEYLSDVPAERNSDN